IGRLVNQPVSVTTEIRGSNGAAAAAAVPASRSAGLAADLPPNAEPAPDPVPERSGDERVILDAARNIFDAEELTPRS
ncbi:MAG: hypothetical protein KC438_04425, partial [Thermomicrobiales bacterium]|nr:hypothetical protein [Thermomicrobiales bacterium]